MAIKESQTQTAIEQYLRMLESLGRLTYIKNNSGRFMNPQGRVYRMGKPGSPDFLIFLPKGKTLHLEVKTPKGRQSTFQKDYEVRIRSLGHDYRVVTSVDQVEPLLKI